MRGDMERPQCGTFSILPALSAAILQQLRCTSESSTIVLFNNRVARIQNHTWPSDRVYWSQMLHLQCPGKTMLPPGLAHQNCKCSCRNGLCNRSCQKSPVDEPNSPSRLLSHHVLLLLAGTFSQSQVAASHCPAPTLPPSPDGCLLCSPAQGSLMNVALQDDCSFVRTRGWLTGRSCISSDGMLSSRLLPAGSADKRSPF